MLARTTTAAHIIQYISSNSKQSRAHDQSAHLDDSLDQSGDFSTAADGVATPLRNGSLRASIGSPGSAGSGSPMSAHELSIDSPARRLYGSAAFDALDVGSPPRSDSRRTMRRTLTRVSIDNLQRTDSTARALESTLEAALDHGRTPSAASLIRSPSQDTRPAALAPEMMRERSLPKVASAKTASPVVAVTPATPPSVAAVARPAPAPTPPAAAAEESESESESSSESSDESEASGDSDEETLPQLLLDDINDPETLRDMLREEEAEHADAKDRQEDWASQAIEFREKLIELAQRTIEYKQILWADKEALVERLDRLDDALDAKKLSVQQAKEQVVALEAEIALLKEQYAASKAEWEEILREEIQSRELEQRSQFRTLAELLEDIEKVKAANEQSTQEADAMDADLRQVSDALYKTRTELLNVILASKEIEEQLEAAKAKNLLLRGGEADDEPGAPSAGPIRITVPVSPAPPSVSVSTAPRSASSFFAPQSPAFPTPDAGQKVVKSVSSPDYHLTPPPADNVAPTPLISVSGDGPAAGRSAQFAVKSFIPARPGVKAGIKCMTEVENTIWLGMGDGTIRIINGETGMIIEERKFHNGSVNDIKCIRGKFAWSCGRESKSTESETRRKSFIFSSDPTSPERELERDNSAGKDKEKFVVVWDSKKKSPLHKINVGVFYCTQILEVDTLVWLGFIGGRIKIYDPKTYKMQKEIECLGECVNCIAKVNKRVWVGLDQSITVFNSATLKPVKVLSDDLPRGVDCLLPVGSREVWSCGKDLKVRCWSACEPYECLKVMDTSCRIFALCEMDQFVWASGWDPKSIFIFDSETRDVANTLVSSHGDTVGALLLSHKTHRMWSASWDGTMTVWASRAEVMASVASVNNTLTPVGRRSRSNSVDEAPAGTSRSFLSTSGSSTPLGSSASSASDGPTVGVGGERRPSWSGAASSMALGAGATPGLSVTNLLGSGMSSANLPTPGRPVSPVAGTAAAAPPAASAGPGSPLVRAQSLSRPKPIRRHDTLDLNIVESLRRDSQSMLINPAASSPDLQRPHAKSASYVPPAGTSPAAAASTPQPQQQRAMSSLNIAASVGSSGDALGHKFKPAASTPKSAHCAGCDKAFSHGLFSKESAVLCTVCGFYAHAKCKVNRPCKPP